MRYAFPILISLMFLSVLWDAGYSRGYVRGPFHVASDSDKDTTNEKGTTPTTRSDFMIDSVTKPIRFLTKSGDTTTKYIPREMLMRAYDGYTYTGRDSVFEFVDTTCIKWYMKLPDSKTRHVRIYAIDTCNAAPCTPVIGDEDNEFKSACDSVKIKGLQSWVHVSYFFPYDEAVAYGKTMSVSVDTMWVPITYEIFASRDSAGTAYPDSARFSYWFRPSAQSGSQQQAFPIGMKARIGKIAWTSWRSGVTGPGGFVVIPSTSFYPYIDRDCSMLLRWITNPASRSGGNNKTMLSLYQAPLSYGGQPPLYSPLTDLKHIAGPFEIEDQSLTIYQNYTIRVTVWLYNVIDPGTGS